MTDPLPELPDLRASDADRERAVEILRRAGSDGQLTVDELEERVSAAYAARTRRELEPLTADISSATATAPAEGEGGLTVKPGPGGDRWVISVMGGHDKSGRWRVAPRCTAVNVMGGSDIDLNDAELSEPVTEVNMYSFMGGGTIRVPHGVEVHVSNFALMGGNGVKLGDEVAPPGAPVIRIRLVSIMGGSEVNRGRKPTRAERKRERELRKADRRELDP
ncbi:MAG: DUF1707 domain-containing protein [Solirubrobacterales bacterium]|nr:DUF1707 domain-containing protein [Solirubrobacterales bacterium]